VWRLLLCTSWRIGRLLWLLSGDCALHCGVWNMEALEKIIWSYPMHIKEEVVLLCSHWGKVVARDLHLFNISSLRTCARYSSDFCKDRKIRTQEKADKVKISNRRNREMNVSVLTQILTCNKAVILETETYKPIVKMSETARVNRALCFSKAVQHMKSRKT